MRNSYHSFIVIVGLAALVHAEVKPIIYDRPLALRRNQPEEVILSRQTLPQIDDWLNLRINSDQSGQVQNEQQVVIHAQNPDNLVAVWRDFRLGYRRIGVGYSFDGGWIWHDELFPQPQYPWQSDPGLTWHTSGAIYAIVLSFDPVGEDGLFVCSSLDGGVSWGPFMPAVNGVPDSFEDKELMACDRTGSPYDGNLYIAWTRFTNFQTISRITMVRSTNGGQSWSAALPVSDDTGVQWPVPAVGPEGKVYIAWVDYSPASIKIDVSNDGGQTWGTDRLVQATSFASAYINPQLLIFAFPAMDVDVTNGPNRGNVYIAYGDEWYGDTDIFFTRSADGGRSWSDPIRVNDDAQGNGCDQFHPWLVCDEQGTLHLIFYDRRNDPAQNLFMDLYYTYSTNAGLSWSPNERITTVSSNPANDSLDSGLIGEYNGLAVRNGVIHPVWTDARDLNQDTYTAVWDTITSVPHQQRHPLAGTQIGYGLDAAPSPFNSTVSLTLNLPVAGWVELAVYDLAGRKAATIFEGNAFPGELRKNWHPTGASGVYIIAAKSLLGVKCQKVLYLR